MFWPNIFMTFRKELGDKGEKIAEKYLRKQRYRILERNFQSRFGEIDLVAREKNEIIFVEVKTKTGANFGFPEQEFSFAKKQKMRRAIQSWLWENKITHNNWRVDLVAIDYSQNPKAPQLRHYKYLNL